MLRRLRTLWRRGIIENELDEELRDHLDRQTELHIARGAIPAEARRQALIEFGGLEQTKERCRDVRGFTLLEGLAQDVRFGTRMFARHPAFTAAAVLSLALGTGANTALFSLVDAALLKPLPVRNPHELVTVTAVKRSGSWFSNLDAEVWDEVRNTQAFEGVFASWRRWSNLRAPSGDTDRVSVSMVTGQYYETLGVHAFLGRAITAGDERDAPQHLVAVLSHSYWSRRFSSDPSVLGRTVFLNAAPVTVVGIEPPGFFGMDRGSPPDITIPLQRSEVSSVWIVGRLASATSRSAALAKVNAAMARALATVRPRLATWHESSRDAWLSMRAGFVAADRGGEAGTLGQHEKLLLVLMLMSVTILLIACANVSNLLLARTAARGGEISLRLAIGASRGRLVRQLMTEGAILAAVSAALGVLIAFWARRLLLGWFMGEEQAASIQVPLDLRVLVFTAAVAIAVVLLCGLAPALRATRVDLISALKPASARSLRLTAQRALLVVQVAASLALIVGAGLLSRTLTNLRRVDPGFRAEDVVLMNLDTAAISAEPTVVAPLVERITQRIQEIPGVQSVSVGANVVFGNGGWNKSVWPEGYSVDRPAGARFNTVGPSYFETLGVPVILGREFDSRDRRGRPKVAVVNEAFVKAYWPDKRNPLGLRFGDRGAAATGTYEVVGVVRDIKIGSLREEAGPTVYDSILQSGFAPRGVTLQIRTRGNPTLLVPRLREQLRTVHESLPVHSIRTLQAAVSDTLRGESMMARLSSFFSVLALILTGIGVYGIVSYTVEQRTHEIGIRIALGARSHAVIEEVMRQTLTAVVVGVAIGVPIALASVRALKTLLFGLDPGDPATLFVAIVAVIAAGALAAYLPARRAAGLEPMTALRRE